MATRVVRESAVPADLVVERLAAGMSPRPQRSRLDRMTGGFDIADAIAVEGGVYASGHVQVWIRHGFGRQDSGRPTLTGQVVAGARGGSRFEGTVEMGAGVVAAAAVTMVVGSLAFVGGVVGEVWTLTHGGSATGPLPALLIGAAFVGFGIVLRTVVARGSQRRDEPLLLAWLDAALDAPVPTIEA